MRTRAADALSAPVSHGFGRYIVRAPRGVEGLPVEPRIAAATPSTRESSRLRDRTPAEK